MGSSSAGLVSRCGGATEGLRRSAASPAPNAGSGDAGRPDGLPSGSTRPRSGDAMDTFDFVIVGAGPAGEAAAHKARELGATVAIVDRRWFGGSCPFIGCVPSKSLLNAAARHAANPATYDWPRASARRDYMVNRSADAADAGRHEPRHGARGGRRHRRPRRRPDRRSRPGRRPPRRRASTSWPAANVVIAVGSTTKVPPIEGDRARSELDEPRGDARPRAASQPARPRRRADRLRAGPGLRPVRRPDHDRPVRAAAHADRPSAQLGGRREGARPRRGGRPARGPGDPGPRGSRDGRRPRRRPRRRLDGRGLGDPARGRPGVPARRARPRALRARRVRPGAVPARRPAQDRRRAVGRRRSGRSRAAHPPGPLPGRARSPDGARRVGRARLPGAAPGDLHRSRGDARSG